MSLPLRPLGATGIMVSAVGVGNMTLCGNRGAVAEEDAVRTLRRAFDRGVTFFDTADAYGRGQGERLLAKAFKGLRDRVVIATKGGTQMRPDRKGRCFEPEYLRWALGESLKRLETDRVDLYQLHNPPEEAIEKGEVFETLEGLKGQGLIRAYGVSISGWLQGLKVLEKANPGGLQVIYNLIRREPGRDLFPAAKARGCGIVVRVPLARGMLSSRYPAGAKYDPEDKRWPSEKEFLDYQRRADAVRFLERPGRTLAQASIRYILAHPAVSTLIPGVHHERHVDELAAALQAPPLSAEEMAAVEALDVENPPVP